jgi:hypothetical protein
MIGPEGKELPPGHGSPKEGAAVFAKRCQVCHGVNGEGGAVRRLVLGSPGNPHRGTFKESEKSALSYYPYPTIVWTISTARCPPAIRDRSPQTKFIRWWRFCSIGTASSERWTSWTPTRFRRSKCRIGMVSFRQFRRIRRSRNPVGGERGRRVRHVPSRAPSRNNTHPNIATIEIIKMSRYGIASCWGWP